MKSRTLFIIFIVAFLLLIYWAESTKPKSFDWRVTYQPESTEPFGCKLFDEMMQRTMPKGYELTDKNLEQLVQDSITSSQHNILILNENAPINGYNKPHQLDSIYKLVRMGSNVLIAQDSFGTLSDSLGIEHIEYTYLSGMFSQLQMSESDTLVWRGTSPGPYPWQNYYLKPIMSGAGMCVSSPDWEKFIVKNINTPFSYYDYDEEKYLYPSEERTIFIRRKIGKGSLYLLTAPLLLSNYSITHEPTAQLALRIMNCLSDKPTLRTTAYLPKPRPEQTPQISYISTQAPLLMAYRLALLGVLLFFIFNAKRRQRAIPVVPAPTNHQLEFVKQIGTLYYQRADHADLTLKKFQYLKEYLRREVQIDISEPSGDEESIPQLAALTGYSERHLKDVVSNLRVLERQQHPYLSQDEMTKYINDINNIYNSIN